MKVAVVKFAKGAGNYHYFCPFNVLPGSNVVVDSPHDGYVVVEVVAIKEADTGNNARKRVVCVVDDTDYKDYLTKQERKKVILAQLEEKKKAVEELAMYKFLADNGDTEAASLLEELKDLEK